MTYFGQITFSVFITLALGFFVRNFLNMATSRMEPPKPKKSMEQDDWEEIYKPGETKADKGIASATWLGTLERLAFLAAFWAEYPTIILGWLAFKVAAKWKVWEIVVQVPSDTDENQDKYSYLRIRNVWGSWLYLRFLIGTLSNLLIAAVAYYIAYYLPHFLTMYRLSRIS